MQKIRLNGEVKEINCGINLAQLVDELKLEPEKIVVQQNGNIITHDKFAEYIISSDDEIELLKFMAGG